FFSVGLPCLSVISTNIGCALRVTPRYPGSAIRSPTACSRIATKRSFFGISIPARSASYTASASWRFCARVCPASRERVISGKLPPGGAALDPLFQHNLLRRTGFLHENRVAGAKKGRMTFLLQNAGSLASPWRLRLDSGRVRFYAAYV